ncbi:MAG: hypothetical protein HY913_04525 [Desulfomonile tiedjei]|nr:hypothetical protein [Desulfomonile tiedjei]
MAYQSRGWQIYFSEPPEDPEDMLETVEEHFGRLRCGYALNNLLNYIEGQEGLKLSRPLDEEELTEVLNLLYYSVYLAPQDELTQFSQSITEEFECDEDEAIANA